MSNRLLIVQVTLVVVGALIALYYKGQPGAVGALYGGGIALINSFLLVRRVGRAGEMAKTDPKQSVYVLYFGAIERFVFALVGLGVGLALFKLDAVSVLAMFGLAQLAYMLPGQSTK
ncbi:MAG: ATP synthase subunit I [bacterium]